jgi:hypothetical protein
VYRQARTIDSSPSSTIGLKAAPARIHTDGIFWEARLNRRISGRHIFKLVRAVYTKETAQLRPKKSSSNREMFEGMSGILQVQPITKPTSVYVVGLFVVVEQKKRGGKKGRKRLETTKIKYPPL